QRVHQPTRSMRRIGKCDAGAEVFVVVRPQVGGVIHFAAGQVADDAIDGLTVVHGLSALGDVGVEIEVGRDLIAIGFVNGLQQRVTKTCGERQVGGDVPGVLRVPIELPRAKVLGDERALRNLHVLGGAVVLRGDLGNQTENVDSGDVIGSGVVGINF